jgi:DNA transformation protein
MSSSPEYVAHCLDLLSVIGSPRARRMFGGHGIDVDGLFLALIVADRLYLKADEATRAEFERAGCQPFEYLRRGGQQAVMSYWTAPEDAMESPALMLPWARLAMASALRAAASKRPATARKPAAKAKAKLRPTPSPAARRKA